MIRNEDIETLLSLDIREVVEEFGVDIINDVSEGTGSSQIPPETDNCEEMFLTVARLGVPYVLMSVRADLAQSLKALSRKVIQLHALGVKDILIDPGFGFGKTMEENLDLLDHLDQLTTLFREPLLVGVSRKRMIYKTLNITPEEALNGTIALDTIALDRGARILRVHDVAAARQTVVLYRMLHGC